MDQHFSQISPNRRAWKDLKIWRGWSLSFSRWFLSSINTKLRKQKMIQIYWHHFFLIEIRKWLRARKKTSNEIKEFRCKWQERECLYEKRVVLLSDGVWRFTSGAETGLNEADGSMWVCRLNVFVNGRLRTTEVKVCLAEK